MSASGPWEYDDATGLYYFEGLGEGFTLAQVQALEDEVQKAYERLRQTTADRSNP